MNKYKPVYGLLSIRIWIFLVSQYGSALDPLQGGESQLPQNPAVFSTPFFSQITIEKLISTLHSKLTMEKILQQ